MANVNYEWNVIFIKKKTTKTNKTQSSFFRLSYMVTHIAGVCDNAPYHPLTIKLKKMTTKLVYQITVGLPCVPHFPTKDCES